MKSPDRAKADTERFFLQQQHLDVLQGQIVLLSNKPEQPDSMLLQWLLPRAALGCAHIPGFAERVAVWSSVLSMTWNIRAAARAAVLAATARIMRLGQSCE
jgi:hypothetical protein